MGNSAITRMIILEKAFELIYKNGYQATSVDDIIAKTKVTKGAFYYNFKTKEQMGLALINEFMHMHSYKLFVEPLSDSSDPVKDIYNLMHKILLDTQGFKIECGCPVHNLVQEMGGLNKEFNKALLKNIELAKKALVSSLQNGIKKKLIRKTNDPEAIANFIISGYAGVRNLGKLYQTDSCYRTHLKEFKTYLENLR